MNIDYSVLIDEALYLLIQDYPAGKITVFFVGEYKAYFRRQ